MRDEVEAISLIEADEIASSQAPRNDGGFTPHNDSRIFFAGQITGVEGYTESAATGIVVARSILNAIQGKEKFIMPEETMLGSLVHYVTHCDPKRFQPINSNWGLLNKSPETLEKKYRKNKKLRYEFLADKALTAISP